MKGHVRKRGNSWTVVLSLGRDPVSGKRIRKWYPAGPRKRDAEALRIKLLNDVQMGVFQEPSNETTGEFLSRWLSEYAKPNVSAKTYLRYRGIVETHLIPRLGPIRLQDLRSRHISGCYAAWAEAGRADGREGGLSPQTILHHHRLLKQTLKYAVQQQLIARNPADVVSPPRVTQSELITLSPVDLERLIGAANDSDMGPIVRMAAYTGMRQAEVLGLRWQDVDFENRRVLVRQTVQYIPGEGFLFGPPKTAQGRRAVSIPPSVIEGLIVMQARQAEKKTLLGSAYRDFDLVFTVPDGGPIDARNLIRKFDQIVSQAGIPGITWHGLRHAHASMLLAKNVPILLVSKRLGHSSPTVTLNTYGHLLPDMDSDLADRLDDLMAPSSA